jgi:hypothetical protein
VEHDDRQVAQRPLQRAGEVLTTDVILRQDDPLHTPSTFRAVTSTKISPSDMAMDTTMSMIVHADALRRDHPIV